MQLDSSIAAIVTGGASGLGEASARMLASRGVKVSLFDLNAARGESVAREIGGCFCQVDVTSEESVEAGFARAREAHGNERVLINCAGIGNAIKTAARDKSTGAITHFASADFDRIVQINLVGTFRCIARSAAGMLALQPGPGGDRGVIINTASVAAEDGQIGQAAYAASKAGIVGLTLPVARDLASEGIRINTILPGTFRTPRLSAIPEHVQSALVASIPFPRRLGEPEEFAHMVISLIENGYMNGACVRLDGAIRMPPR